MPRSALAKAQQQLAANQGMVVGAATIITASSHVIWTDWNALYTANTSSATTIWQGWNNQYSTGALTTSATNAAADTTWYYWINGNLQSAGSLALAGNQYAQHVTPQYRASPAEIERARVATEARQQARVVADDRATKLLVAHLTPAQREQYQKDRHFDVHTARGGKIRRYRLTHGWAGNVFLMDENDRQVERFCIHPTKNVPYADNLLAQKLLLETDESEFLRIANKTRMTA